MTGRQFEAMKLLSEIGVLAYANGLYNEQIHPSVIRSLERRRYVTTASRGHFARITPLGKKTYEVAIKRYRCWCPFCKEHHAGGAVCLGHHP